MRNLEDSGGRDLSACELGGALSRLSTKDGARHEARAAEVVAVEDPADELSSGEEADAIREELASWRTAKEAAICQRFEDAKASGDLSPDADPDGLARYIATILQGLSVQAAGGATREELLRVVETAMLAWPST